jgi:hypothetical protein
VVQRRRTPGSETQRQIHDQGYGVWGIIAHGLKFLVLFNMGAVISGEEYKKTLQEFLLPHNLK